MQFDHEYLAVYDQHGEDGGGIREPIHLDLRQEGELMKELCQFLSLRLKWSPATHHR